MRRVFGVGALVFGIAIAWAPACSDGSSEQPASTAAGGSAGSTAAGGSAGSTAAGGSAGSTAADARAGSGGSTADAAPDRVVDCSNVGCSPPPFCSEGCQAVCGCCACAEGSTSSMNGNTYVCRGGCYAPQPDGSSATWTAFAVNNGYGPCPQGQVCSSSWRVTPDGAIQARKEGVDSAPRMSQADLRELDAILLDASFRRDMVDGFECPMVFDVFTSITLFAPDEQTQSVTGCVLDQNPATPVAKAVSLVTKY